MRASATSGRKEGPDQGPRSALRTRRPQPDIDRSPRVTLAFFVVAGLAALIVVGGGAFLASRRVGLDIATDEVRQLGATLARTIADHHIDEGLVAGETASLASFDLLVKRNVLSDTVVRVKLWDETGRILYSDEDELIGQRFELEPHEIQALESGEAAASLTDLDEPSNAREREFGQLIEVYTPVIGPDGQMLLFEIYVSSGGVVLHRNHIWGELIPVVLGVVLVLGAVQLPLAWSTTSRLRRSQHRRLALQKSVMEAADCEDRRIARELHDGVVQDLAASSFLLAAAKERIGEDNAPAIELVVAASQSVRTSIGDLRALIQDLYPAPTENAGLRDSVHQLVDQLVDANVTSHLDIPEPIVVDTATLTLIYRTIRESVRNVVKHAAAQRLSVIVSSHERPLYVEIVDDGKGFNRDESVVDGHLGLRLLEDLATDMGAHLEVTSVEGRGTTVRLEVPA